MAYKRLGDILVSAGTISQEELEKALNKAREQKKRIGEYLIEQGIISENQLIDVLRVQLGIDYVDLSKVTISNSLATVVPKNMSKNYNVVPVKVEGNSLYLAMSDPLNFNAIEDIRSATKKRIVPMISTTSAIDRAIVMLYGNEGVSRAIDEMQKTIQEETVDSIDSKQQNLENYEQAAPTVRIVNSIIERGVSEGASDIHIEPRTSGLIIRMRIDGVLHKILEIPQNLQNAVISRIKIMCEMDIAEKRIPQDGRCNVTIGGKDIDLRISSVPAKYGEKIVIRFLEKSDALLSVSGIGLKGKLLENYNELLKNSNGVILLCGPTGSGKSTTMYTMISGLNSEDVNLITLEDPIEYNIDGVNQIQVNEKVGLTFASGLRSILRQDPDIISVGEIRDGETAEIAMRAAITGHLVLSTIHTNSAIATVDRLVDIGVEPYLIASALKGVIAQRLVRRICPNCRTEYEASEEELKTLGIKKPAKKIILSKGLGCPECMHTGYKGRTAVFEILMVNQDVRRCIRERKDEEELMKAVEESGFTTMRDDAIRLVKEGVTTVSEATRILHTTD